MVQPYLPLVVNPVRHRRFDNPFLFLAPLGADLLFADKASNGRMSNTLTASGAVRRRPGIDPVPENPILTDARLAGSLAMQDRSGAFTATGSGALRYRVGPGGRVNYCENPRGVTGGGSWFNNSSGVVSYGIAVSDHPLGIATAARISGSTGIGDNNADGGAFVGRIDAPTVSNVYSFYAKLETGAADWSIVPSFRTAADGNIGSSNPTDITLTTSWQRFSVTVTPSATAAGIHRLRLKIVRKTSNASQILVTGCMIESGATLLPYLDGASGSPSAWLDPITGALGTANNSPSTNIAAIWPEEATTNYFSDPMGVNFPGYGANYNSQGGNPPTATKDTSYGYGPAGQAIKLVSPGSGASEGILIYTPAGLAIAGGGSFAHSVWVRGSGTMQYGCNVLYTDATADSSASNTIVLTDSWQKITMPVIASNGAKTVDRTSLYVRTNSAQATTFWLSCWQSEQKTYSTSFCAGSLGTGYAWTGSANASSSTRTVGLGSASTQGRIDPRRGFFAGWFLRDYDTATYHVLWDTGVAAGERLTVHINTSDLLTLHGGMSSGAALLTRPTAITPGTWFFAYAAWDGPNVWLSLNGETPVAGTRVDAVNPSNATLYFGSTNGATPLDGGMYGDQFGDQPLTAADLARLYNGGTPPTSLGWNFIPTTYLKPARINLVKNPRFAVDTSNWSSEGGGQSIARVADSDFTGGFAVEATSDATLGSAVLNVGTGAGLAPIASKVAQTISFEGKLASGANDFQVSVFERNAAGSNIGSAVGAFFTLTSTKQRIAFSYTPTATGVHFLTFKIYRVTGAVSVSRFSAFVLESGTVSNPTYFDGATANACWLDPITGYLGTAHASASVSGAALWPEEGTTNTIPDPSFEAATITTNWTASGAATISKVTTHAYVGSNGGKVSCTALTTDGILNATASAPAAASGQAWTLQARIRAFAAGDVGKTVALQINERDSGGANVATNRQGSVTLTDAFQLFTYTVTLAGGGTVAKVTGQFMAGAATAVDFVLDAVQLEQKAYATSFAAGDIGTGYAWTGTAHASSSTRTACQVTTPTDYRVYSNAGALIGRVVYEYFAGAIYQDVFGTTVQGAGFDRFVLTKATNHRMQMIVLSGTSQDAATHGTTLTPGVPHLAYGDWTPTRVRVRVDSDTVVVGNRTFTPTGIINGKTIGIGVAPGGVGNSDGGVGSVAIMKRPLTDREYERHRVRPIWNWNMHDQAA